MSSLTSRFDWYQATFDDLDDLRVAQNLAISLGGALVVAKPYYGYSRAWAVEHEDKALVKVFGGSPRGGEVHVQTSSQSCDVVVPLLRKLWPVHRVTRADSSYDFHGTYKSVRDVAKAFADERGIFTYEHVNSDGGATLELGSRSSERQVKVYDKTAELKHKHPERAGEIPEGIIRAELQFRPSKRPAKARVSVMNPDDLWGLSAWTKDLASTLLGFEAERVTLRFKVPSDWSRSVHYLGEHYGPSVARRLETHSPEEVKREVLLALGLPL